MDVSGERRLPAARDVVWRALSDMGTVGDSLPAQTTIVRRDEGHFDITVAGWQTRATLEPASGPAQSSLHLAAPASAAQGLSGRAELTMVEDGVFTRVLWRLSTNAPEDARARIEAAVDQTLAEIGQRAATPAPVAAQGLAGAATAIADAAPLASEKSPLQVIIRQLLAMPRDSTVGGAVFMLVVLFVVGIL
jgi:carbon monoxide dehydrogenase subunit G